MVAHLTAIGDIKDANRRSPQFNHLSTVAEGIPAAGWVAVVSSDIRPPALLMTRIGDDNETLASFSSPLSY